ncbi:hypothetical protein [Duganella callida]|uniref:Endonuclease/exonuclease/phosphatase family protein n=1 Tax=Duganella callida TaxID=2561932 RepID=A0A4Y9SAR9_9BURK|nr:hypothetical protein [Duganella callida]TFW16809.1 hypothetical protein E4L98_22420 [Duganella callida]
MPIFSYQSFNAGNQSKHDLVSVTAQKLTVETHDHLAASTGAARLVYPTLHDESFDSMNYPDGRPADRHLPPVQGPARLVATAPVGTISQTNVRPDEFFDMMKYKVLQNRQGVFREMQQMPHVTAFGELNGANADFRTMNEYVVSDLAGATANKKACNNFSVYCSNGIRADCVGQGDGWYAINYLGYTVVFVHVPNRLMKGAKPPVAAAAKPGALRGVGATHQAKPAAPKPYARSAGGETTEDRLVTFYKGIADTIIQNGGGVIDLIMGDTNQSSGGVTPSVVSKATSLDFKSAHTGSISPIDGYKVSVGGTNSKGDKMYDVAVYNAATVRMKKICYWSQLAPVADGSAVAAVTDHMGLAVDIELI